MEIPNHTIYVRNINDKVKKEELKRSLFALFSTYGHIIDIVAVKTPKMREQAFIVYQEIQSATSALRSLQNFIIEYAKTKSDAIAMLDGTYRRKMAEKAQMTLAELTGLKRQREETEQGIPKEQRPKVEEAENNA